MSSGGGNMQGTQYARFISAILSTLSLKREQGKAKGEPEVIINQKSATQALYG